MPARKFSVSMTQDLVNEVARRDDTAGPDPDRVNSTILSRELERYYGLLARERALLRRQFSEGELALMADACNGTLWQPETIPLFAAGIEDAIQMDHLDDKWDVDGKALLAKLRTLSTGSLFALVDAIELWWNGVALGEDKQPGQVLG